MNEPLAYRVPSEELEKQISENNKLTGALEVLVKILENYQRPSGEIVISHKDWDALTAPYLRQSKLWKSKE